MVYVPADLPDCDAEGDEHATGSVEGDETTDAPACVVDEHSDRLEALQQEVDALTETVRLLAREQFDRDDLDLEDESDGGLVDEHGETDASDLRGFY